MLNTMTLYNDQQIISLVNLERNVFTYLPVWVFQF